MGILVNIRDHKILKLQKCESYEIPKAKAPKV